MVFREYQGSFLRIPQWFSGRTRTINSNKRINNRINKGEVALPVGFRIGFWGRAVNEWLREGCGCYKLSLQQDDCRAKIPSILLTEISQSHILACMSHIADVDPDKKYSTIEAAEILSANPRQVRRWANSGLLGQIERKSPVPRSPRMISGQAIIDFIKKRNE